MRHYITASQIESRLGSIDKLLISSRDYDYCAKLFHEFFISPCGSKNILQELDESNLEAQKTFNRCSGIMYRCFLKSDCSEYKEHVIEIFKWQLEKTKI